MTGDHGLPRPRAGIGRTAPGTRIGTGAGRTGTGAGRTGPYACDAATYRLASRAVACPRSAEGISAPPRACRASGIPVTARGGGTSGADDAVGADGNTVVVADGFGCATRADPRTDRLTGGRGVRAVPLAELLDPAADQ
ncbi:FAD-binding protein [Streptomyces avermitilis]